MLWVAMADQLCECYEVFKPYVLAAAIEIIMHDRGESVTPYILSVVAANAFIEVTKHQGWIITGYMATLKVHRIRYGIKQVIYNKMLSMQAGS